MRTAVCVIARLANQYIREYVDYYKELGFTNIILYDNNFDNEEYFNDVINDYILDGFVIVENFRNKPQAQFHAYNHCIYKYSTQYDWIAFFDVDEFLTLVNDKTIGEFLSNERFNNADSVCINWMCYGDSDLLYNDGSGVLNRFIKPCDFNVQAVYNFSQNNHIKSIVRCKSVNKYCCFNNPHYINGLNNEYMANGEKHPHGPFHNYDFSEAYIRHYITKTIDEYCNKLKIGTPDTNKNWSVNNKSKLIEYLENNFFTYNTITKEKIEIIKNKLNIDLSYLLK